MRAGKGRAAWPIDAIEGHIGLPRLAARSHAHYLSSSINLIGSISMLLAWFKLRPVRANAPGNGLAEW